MVRIYIGGCYNNLEEIREAQQLIEENGFEISYDWTERAKEKNPRTHENLEIDASKDILGVLDADWTILLMTDKSYIYRGTFTELGASIARDLNKNQQQTIIVGSDDTYANDCCFWHHPNIIHELTIENAIETIKLGLEKI